MLPSFVSAGVVPLVPSPNLQRRFLGERHYVATNGQPANMGSNVWECRLEFLRASCPFRSLIAIVNHGIAQQMRLEYFAYPQAPAHQGAGFDGGDIVQEVCG